MQRDWMIVFAGISACLAMDLGIMAYIRTRSRKDLEGLREACMLDDEGLAAYLRDRYLADASIDEDIDCKEVIALAAIKLRLLSKATDDAIWGREGEIPGKLRREGLAVLSWCGVLVSSISVLYGIIRGDRTLLYMGILLAVALTGGFFTLSIFGEVSSISRERLRLLEERL